MQLGNSQAEVITFKKLEKDHPTRVILKAEFLPFGNDITLYAKDLNGRADKICVNTSCPIPLTDITRLTEKKSLFRHYFIRPREITRLMEWNLCSTIIRVIKRQPIIKAVTFSLVQHCSVLGVPQYLVSGDASMTNCAAVGRTRSVTSLTPLRILPDPMRSTTFTRKWAVVRRTAMFLWLQQKTIINALYSLSLSSFSNNNALKNQPPSISPKMQNLVTIIKNSLLLFLFTMLSKSNMPVTVFIITMPYL